MMTSLKCQNKSTDTQRPMQRLLAWMDRHQADLLLGVIFTLITVLYALLMFNDRVPILGFLLLGGLWSLYWVLNGWQSTPLDGLILGLMCFLPISFAISIDRELTRPKIHGVLLGIALFYYFVNFLRSKKRLALVVFGIIILAIGVSLMGLVGTDWYEDKLFELPAVYAALPSLIKDVPRSLRGGGIHFNLIGGGLTFFVPLLVSLLWHSKTFDFNQVIKKERWARLASAAFKILLILGLILVTFTLLLTQSRGSYFILGLILVTFTLLLTQSRGSYLGVLVGVLALAIIRDRRSLWAIPIIIVVLLTILQRYAQGDLAALITLLDTSRGGTLPGRFEIWRRATLLVQDFPFTGAGMGTFSPLANALYPYFAGSNPQIPHAHNMILTMAVDLGIPGLVLYTALFSGSVVMLVKRSKKAAPDIKAMLIGLACGLLAHQVFGIMDAYMLGTKLGAIQWIYFGLATALYLGNDQSNNRATAERTEQKQLTGQNAKRRISAQMLLDVGQGITYWLMLSLFSIAFINVNIILSLVLAVLGGVALGVILVRGFAQSSEIAGDHA